MTKYKFQYIAKSYSDGSEHRGTIEAEDRNAAIAAIRANGLMPTALGQILNQTAENKCQTKKNSCFSVKKILKSVAKAIDRFADNF